MVSGYSGMYNRNAFFWNRLVPVVPSIYSHQISEEQQILWLMKQIRSLWDELKNYLTLDEFDAYKDWAQADQDAQTEFLRKYTDLEITVLRNELIDLINRLVMGQVIIFDPTRGDYRFVGEVVNRVYDYDREQGIAAMEFDRMGHTVEEFEAKIANCIAFDIYANTLLGEGVPYWKMFLELDEYCENLGPMA